MAVKAPHAAPDLVLGQGALARSFLVHQVDPGGDVQLEERAFDGPAEEGFDLLQRAVGGDAGAAIGDAVDQPGPRPPS